MLSEDVLTRLQDQGIATPGVNLFKTVTPHLPDECLTVREIPGSGLVRTMGHVSCEGARFQLFSRGLTHNASRDLIWRAFYALDGFGGTLNGVRYLWIWAAATPSFYGLDENNRFLAIVTFDVLKDLTPV